ncbi:hypothetical protein PILCRDRAFT_823689 [Piloderma croceum F 1598]|uniref:DUF1772 domain-containing protein n=1 Tax=Piloderma croceum (strain F 1598) TaxID=765440 RepID=A0A0C3F310_PILCF|nr:hypothetical protein PILCRDRAFT_823689 [Piloderma croceum F 1598]
MSILETLYYRLASDPAQLPLIAGVVSSSYFYFGNLGGAYFGVVPAIQDLELPVDTKVALWKWSYDRAMIHMGRSMMTSVVSFSTAALLTSSPSVRNLLLGAAAMSFAVGPWTLIRMLPINNELADMHKGQALQANKTTEITALDKRALNCLDEWRALHRVRVVFGLGAWITGLTALVVGV